MKKQLVGILSLFIFICNSTANAQHDFQPGYIVTNTNDTIHGLIDYGISRSNSVSCNFKSDSSAAVKSYSPDELKAYAISEKNYYLTKSIKTGSGSMNYFVECLVKGIINLYYYNDLGIEHYLVEQTNILYELKNDEVSFVEDGKTYFKKSNQYKGALTYLMKDVPAMSSEIQNTNFNAKSLINLIEKYHKMIGKENYMVYKKQEKKRNYAKWKFKFGISAGFNYSIVKIWADYMNMPYSFTLNSSPTLSTSSMTIFPGIALNINKNNKNSLQLEFLYLRNKYATNGFTIKTDYLVLPLLYKREFNYYKRIKPFVDLGASLRYENNMQINNLYAEVTIPKLQGNKINDTQVIYYINRENSSIEAKSFRIVMMGGLGLAYDLKKKNRLELELRTECYYKELQSSFDSRFFTTSTFRFWNFGILGRIFI